MHSLRRVARLVQLQPRTPEVEKQFLMTADEGIECLLGRELLKNNICVLSLHEEKLYRCEFKVSTPLTTAKTQGIPIAGENAYMQSENEVLMRFGVADENC